MEGYVRSGWISPRSQFLGYAMVGLGGFLVDASILTLLAVQLGMELFPARCISFTAATLTTWLLNRVFVFSACGPRIHGRLGEYGRYLAVQVVGAATNLAVFFVLVRMLPSLVGVPVLPLAAGALAALGLTYFGSRRFVFSQQSSASTLNGDR